MLITQCTYSFLTREFFIYKVVETSSVITVNNFILSFKLVITYEKFASVTGRAVSSSDFMIRWPCSSMTPKTALASGGAANVERVSCPSLCRYCFNKSALNSIQFNLIIFRVA